MLERRGAWELPGSLDFPLPGLLGCAAAESVSQTKIKRADLEGNFEAAESKLTNIVLQLGLATLSPRRGKSVPHIFELSS